MSTRAFVTIAIVCALILVAAMSVFTVSESQLAIRTEFSAIVGTDYAPGLHFKWPWDQVVKFDGRILSQSYTGETFLTNDNRGLIVDFYVKWRINNAPRFWEAAGGREENAAERLAAIVKDGLKGVVAERTLPQIVTAERAAVTSDMFGQARTKIASLGVDLIDVRVQRIDLPDEVSTRVYEQMKQNFVKSANLKRAEGLSESQRIRSTAEREQTEIVASAERDALRVQGEADAQAAQTYADAYSKDPEFYSFYRSLQAYEGSLGKSNDLLVVTPDGEFFKYLKDPDKKK